MLTPHEGEFIRLGGDLSRGREGAAADFAARHGCVLVLKGPETVVADPDGRLLVNTTGNSGMAKGGSGDVLSGMIAALIGQGAPPFAAAACGRVAPRPGGGPVRREADGVRHDPSGYDRGPACRLRGPGGRANFIEEEGLCEKPRFLH